MNKTFIIFKHEFLRMIRRPGFIILTLSLPVLALLIIGVFQIISGITRPAAEVTKIGYVAAAGEFDQFTTQGNINLVRYENQEAANQALVKKDIKEYFVIPPDFIATGVVNRYITQPEIAPSQDVISMIQSFTDSNLLADKVAPSVITRVESVPILVTTTLTATGAVSPQQGGYANLIVPAVFAFLLAMSLIFSSAYVLQSLGEEKENRLMEILLSSVSTRQLLAGKVLGLGAAGLLQVIIWVVTMPLLLRLASSSIGGILSTIQVPANFWVLGILYFILGYALFAVLSASIAAITSTVQEGQGLASLYTLFSFIPFWFSSLLITFPNSPVWVVFTIFPFSAPVLTMIRMGATGVPVWQLAVSILVLVLCIIGGLLLAARLLRTYMLMYGKRPGLRAIYRGLKAG
jgi:ABC-2 type transport system permease protein